MATHTPKLLFTVDIILDMLLYSISILVGYTCVAYLSHLFYSCREVPQRVIRGERRTILSNKCVPNMFRRLCVFPEQQEFC